MSTLIEFIDMGGYGLYVFSAYGCVLTFLLAQWFLPWRRWQKYLSEKQTSS